MPRRSDQARGLRGLSPEALERSECCAVSRLLGWLRTRGTSRAAMHAMVPLPARIRRSATKVRAPSRHSIQWFRDCFGMYLDLIPHLLANATRWRMADRLATCPRSSSSSANGRQWPCITASRNTNRTGPEQDALERRNETLERYASGRWSVPNDSWIELHSFVTGYPLWIDITMYRVHKVLPARLFQ